MSRAQFDGYLRQIVALGPRIRANGERKATLDCGHKTTTNNVNRARIGKTTWIVCSTCRDLGRKEAR